jgi:hypothetical protein
MKGEGLFILNGRKTSYSQIWRYYIPTELILFLRVICFADIFTGVMIDLPSNKNKIDFLHLLKNEK